MSRLVGQQRLVESDDVLDCQRLSIGEFGGRSPNNHSGQGLGGGLALLLAFFVGFVMPYLTSNEVGDLYERSGRSKPVSGLTGLWYFPGMLILIGPIVWFVKTNGALNSYWRSLGVR